MRTAILWISLALMGCTQPSFLYWDHAVAPNGDGTRRVLVEKLCIAADCDFRILLESDGEGTVRLFERGFDSGPTQCDVAWTEDFVAVYVKDGLGPDALVGYDFRRQEKLSAVAHLDSELRRAVAMAVVRRYGLQADDLEAFGGDGVEWLISWEGNMRYSELPDGERGKVLAPIVVSTEDAR